MIEIALHRLHTLRTGAAASLSQRLSAWSGLWFWAGIFGPCSGSSAPPSANQDTPAAVAAAPTGSNQSSPELVRVPMHPKQQTQTTPAFMQGHYDASVRMRQAIIAGKLDEFQRVAAQVAEDDWSPRLRPGYVPFVSSMRDVARQANAAMSLTSGAAELGKLGESCAACHLKFGGPGSPNFPALLPENADPTMFDHALGTDFLWQGLIGPSESSWSTGASVLIEAPSLDSDLGEVAAAAEHLRDLARRATVAEPRARSELFGSILLTCAACHERLGIDASAPPPVH